MEFLMFCSFKYTPLTHKLAVIHTHTRTHLVPKDICFEQKNYILLETYYRMQI